MMNKFLSAVQYLVVFIAIQVFATLAVGLIATNGLAMLIASAASSLLTILLFIYARWSPFSRDFIRTRPWVLLVWVAILACGTIIPSQWMLERLGLEVPVETQQLFEQIMRQPAGYFVVGILVPVAEEMVFRGAILRTLLHLFNHRHHWLPIILSALLFGTVHGNMAQFVHATLLGLLLGWLYNRTGSIVPGLVVHWTNNTIAYVLTMLLPQSSDSTLVELFGSEQRVGLALVCSLCIFLPSLYQVVVKMNKKTL